MISTTHVRRFRALGTTITVIGVEVAGSTLDTALDTARELGEVWEAQFSRFRIDSELSRLNRSGGGPVSDEMLAMIELALEAARRTSGRFHPAVLPALEAAGYDRDFHSLTSAKAPRVTRQGVNSTTLARWEEIEIDRDRQLVRLPANLRLDFGGLAKGVFADRLADRFLDWPGGAVDAGGDLRVWGAPPDGDWWTIGIEDPLLPERDRLLAVVTDAAAFGIATSGVHRRRWRAVSGDAHHLIDPATAAPLAGTALAVTAFAPSAARAEVDAKSLLIAAAREEPLHLELATSAIITYEDGHHATLFEAGEPACHLFPVSPTGHAA